MVDLLTAIEFSQKSSACSQVPAHKFQMTLQKFFSIWMDRKWTRTNSPKCYRQKWKEDGYDASDSSMLPVTFHSIKGTDSSTFSSCGIELLCSKL